MRLVASTHDAIDRVDICEVDVAIRARVDIDGAAGIARLNRAAADDGKAIRPQVEKVHPPQIVGAIEHVVVPLREDFARVEHDPGRRNGRRAVDQGRLKPRRVEVRREDIIFTQTIGPTIRRGTPTIIPAWQDTVDLVIAIRSITAAVHDAGFGMEGEGVGVAESVGPDGRIRVRIIGGRLHRDGRSHAVNFALRQVRVNGVENIVLRPRRDIEHAIRAKLNVAAVENGVLLEGVLDLPGDALIPAHAILLDKAGHTMHDLRSVIVRIRPGGVVEPDVMVLLKPWIERNAEQALLALFIDRQMDHWLRLEDAIGGDHTDVAAFLSDKQAAIRRPDHPRGKVNAEGVQLHLDWHLRFLEQRKARWRGG